MTSTPRLTKLSYTSHFTTTNTTTMRITPTLRAARREAHGMILIWRTSDTTPSPIRAHPGAPVPSDTNPFARDPDPHPNAPPDASASSPSGIPLSQLKSRVRQVGNAQYVNYERRDVPVPHSVPPNFPDDQLDPKRTWRGIPNWVWPVGFMVVLSIVDEMLLGKTRQEAMERRKAEREKAERERSDSEADGRGVGGVAGRSPAGGRRWGEEGADSMNAGGAVDENREMAGWSERMRAMDTKRAQLEERVRRSQANAQASMPRPPAAWGGDDASRRNASFGDSGTPSTDFYGRS